MFVIYYSDELVAKAREMDLLTYLRLYEPENLVKVHGNVYCTREHDSLKISNGKWMWWSRNIGGASALDYLIKVKGKSFTEAMGILSSEKEIIPSIFNARNTPQKVKKLLLPEKNDSLKHITKYLMSRGIDKNIIESLIAEGLLYESKGYHNCIFLGKDDEGKARYAAYRGCTSDRILGEARGSDKPYPFRIETAGDRLHLFEGAIDLLSFATIQQRYGMRWNADSMLSMGGIGGSKSSSIPIAIRRFLREHPMISEIHIHFDNDGPGKAAAKALAVALETKYRVVNEPPPIGKDYNDYLKDLIARNRYERRYYSGNN